MKMPNILKCPCGGHAATMSENEYEFLVYCTDCDNEMLGEGELDAITAWNIDCYRAGVPHHPMLQNGIRQGFVMSMSLADGGI